MITTVLCLLSMGIFFVETSIFPSKKKKNGYEILIISAVLLLILTGLGAGIFSVFHIPVNLYTNTILILGIDAGIFIYILKKKHISKSVWPVCDGISLAMLLILLIVCAYFSFGKNLSITYKGVDPATYFYDALEIIRSQKVSGEYLSVYINAMCIAMCRPFLISVSYYKAFIFSDILMHVLSMGMFYVLASKINHGPKSKYCNVIIAAMYFCGYPLYNLCDGAFFHWRDGILFIMFLIYTIIVTESNEITVRKGSVLFALGCFGIMICYPFFVPIAFAMLIADVLIILCREIKRTGKKTVGILVIPLMSLLAVGAIFAGQRVSHSLHNYLYYLKQDGTIYKSPYMDFLFFVPIFICFLGLLIKKKESWTIARITIAMSAFAVIWFVLYLQEFLSGYYYYRIYYAIWLMAWLMTAQTIHMMFKEKKVLEIVSYGGFCAIILLTIFIDLNQYLYDKKEGIYLDEEQYKTSLFPLYSYNYKMIQQDPQSIISEQKFGLYGHVLDNLQMETVPMITSVYTIMHTQWYYPITYQQHEYEFYDLRYESLSEIFERLQTNDCHYAIILKEDPAYKNYYEKIFSHLEVEYENGEGVIYKQPQDGWESVIENWTDVSQKEMELFEFVQNSGYKSVMLVENELLDKAVNYEIYTGVDSVEWNYQMYPGNFLESTYKLNIENVQYLTILYDSEMYRQNWEYFYHQIYAFENEAGSVIQHAGSGWMPSEQE